MIAHVAQLLIEKPCNWETFQEIGCPLSRDTQLVWGWHNSSLSVWQDICGKSGSISLPGVLESIWVVDGFLRCHQHRKLLWWVSTNAGLVATDWSGWGRVVTPVRNHITHQMQIPCQFLARVQNRVLNNIIKKSTSSFTIEHTVWITNVHQGDWSLRTLQALKYYQQSYGCKGDYAPLIFWLWNWTQRKTHS